MFSVPCPWRCFYASKVLNLAIKRLLFGNKCLFLQMLISIRVMGTGCPPSRLHGFYYGKTKTREYMIDVKATLKESEERMEMAAMFLEEQLSRVRAGRANVAILDGVRVNSYGSMVPLNQVANVSTPDPRTIAIRPWDKKMIKDIEKASPPRTTAKSCAWAYPSLRKSAAKTLPSSATRWGRRPRWRCATSVATSRTS